MPDRQIQTDLDFLGYKVDAIGVQSQNTQSALTKHVDECAAIQKRVYGIVVFLAGWMVAHSPEAGKLFGKIAAVLP